jgi:putative flippase GtrA
MGVLIRILLGLLPRTAREWLLRHREVAKFLVVGGTCFVVTVAIDYALKLSALATKPVTALTIATIAATLLSYALNRRWAFRARGGHRRHHEMILFLAINGAAVAVNDVPLWAARYLFDLQVPEVSRLTQEVSDFASGMVMGTLLAMGFRLWAYRTWVFPRQRVQVVQGAAQPPRPGRRAA